MFILCELFQHVILLDELCWFIGTCTTKIWILCRNYEIWIDIIKCFQVSKSSDEVSTTVKKKLHENAHRRNKKSGNIHRNATLNAIKEIGNKITNLSKNYLHISPQYRYILNDLLGDLKQSSEISTRLWETARKVSQCNIYTRTAKLKVIRLDFVSLNWKLS